MAVADVMTKDVRLIDPDTTIRDAAIRLRDEDVGALPVGENDRLIGMVTDRDITVRAVAADKAPDNTTVREVLSEKIYYCFDDQSLDEVADTMAAHKVRRVPVLNRDKRLVGIVSLADLARARSGDNAARMAYAEVAEPIEAERR